MFFTCTTNISQSLARRSSVHSASDSLIFRDCIYSYKGQTSSTAISPQNFLWSCVTSVNQEVISLSLALSSELWPIRLGGCLMTYGDEPLKSSSHSWKGQVHTNTCPQKHTQVPGFTDAHTASQLCTAVFSKDHSKCLAQHAVMMM